MLSTKEAAERIEAGESSVRLWCTQGKFEGAQRVGRDWIIPEAALKGFVNPGRGRPAKLAEVLPTKKEGAAAVANGSTSAKSATKPTKKGTRK